MYRHRLTEPMTLQAFIHQVSLIPGANMIGCLKAIEDGAIRVDRKKVLDPRYLLVPGENAISIDFVNSTVIAGINENATKNN